MRGQYPRPTMVCGRKWLNLNGLWEYAIAPGTTRSFPPPSTAASPCRFRSSRRSRRRQGNAPDQGSGIGAPSRSHRNGAGRASCSISARWTGRPRSSWTVARSERIAGDTTVHVRHHRGRWRAGRRLPRAAGGSGATHALVVAVRVQAMRAASRAANRCTQPEGIWYTRSSGIWRTVWIEPVPALSIDRLRTARDPRAETIERERRDAERCQQRRPQWQTTGQPTATEVRAAARWRRDRRRGQAARGCRWRSRSQPRLWSPDDPFL